MGQKVNPKGFRLAVNKDWDSRWYASKRQFPGYIAEDHKIRTFLEERLRYASVPRIFIERATDRVRVRVHTARPGVVIGRKGQELDRLRADLIKTVGHEVILDIHEIKKPDLEAKLVAENVALQLGAPHCFPSSHEKGCSDNHVIGRSRYQGSVQWSSWWNGYCTYRASASWPCAIAITQRAHRLWLH